MPVRRVINGGGIPQKNAVLNQVYANVLGKPVLVPEGDVTSLGSAIFAFLAAGAFQTIEEAQDALCPAYRDDRAGADRGRDVPGALSALPQAVFRVRTSGGRSPWKSATYCPRCGGSRHAHEEDRVLEALRAEVLEANLELVRRGLVIYTFGNASGISREQGLVRHQAERRAV